MEASHINGNRADNRVDNLCWETHSENCKRQNVHGTHPDYKGEKHPQAKLTDASVHKLRELRAAGATLAEVAGAFGGSRENAGMLARGARRQEAGGPVSAGVNVGRRLTDARGAEGCRMRAEGKTLREVAEAFNISKAYVSMLSRGLVRGADGVPLTEKGSKVSRRGAEHGNAKLTEVDVTSIRELYAAGVSRQDIAEQFGIRPTYVNQIARGFSWTHAGGPITVGSRN